MVITSSYILHAVEVLTSHSTLQTGDPIQLKNKLLNLYNKIAWHKYAKEIIMASVGDILFVIFIYNL